MFSKCRRFVPRLEALGDRALPSVSWQVFENTLTITGTADPDTVIISDAGTETGVLVNGVPVDTTVPISAIIVQTFGGADTVIYNLTGPLTTTRLVSVDLGRGADAFTANLNGQTISGTSRTWASPPTATAAATP